MCFVIPLSALFLCFFCLVGSSVCRASTPREQYVVGLNPEQLFFHWEKRCSGLLYCLVLITSKKFTCILDIEFEFTLFIRAN